MPAATITQKSRSRSHDAYRAIRRKIIEGQLAPGKVLTEKSIADEVNLGRTPVREAIRRLQHEGIVQQVPRWGTVVRSIARREVAELYDMLYVLQSRAAYLAASRIDDAALLQLEGLCEQMLEIDQVVRDGRCAALEPADVRRWVKIDAIFHMLIVRSAGNPRMTKTISELRDRTRIAMHGLPLFDLNVLARFYAFHRRLLRALKKRDGRSAGKAMRQSVRFRTKIVLAMFAASPAPRLDDMDDLFDDLAQLENEIIPTPSATRGDDL